MVYGQASMIFHHVIAGIRQQIRYKHFFHFTITSASTGQPFAFALSYAPIFSSPLLRRCFCALYTPPSMPPLSQPALPSLFYASAAFDISSPFYVY